jgi:hypothetical protein
VIESSNRGAHAALRHQRCEWRSRPGVEDNATVSKERRSTVVSELEEAAIISPRVQARIPLDDVYIALKDVIPYMSRSPLHRCLQRHGISHLPKADREKPKRVKSYDISNSISILLRCDMRVVKHSSSLQLIAP